MSSKSAIHEVNVPHLRLNIFIHIRINKCLWFYCGIVSWIAILKHFCNWSECIVCVSIFATVACWNYTPEYTVSGNEISQCDSTGSLKRLYNFNLLNIISLKRRNVFVLYSIICITEYWGSLFTYIHIECN